MCVCLGVGVGVGGGWFEKEEFMMKKVGIVDNM